MIDEVGLLYICRACFSVTDMCVTVYVLYPYVSVFADTNLFMDLSFVITAMQPQKGLTMQQNENLIFYCLSFPCDLMQCE